MNTDIKKCINNPSVTISKIKFNNDYPIELKSDDIVIFVGANNVGKSRVLKDIKDDLIESSNKKIIISEIEYKSTNFDKNSVIQFFDRNFNKDQNGNYNVYIDDSFLSTYSNYSFDHLPDSSKNFYKILYTFLSTENRLNITAPIFLNQLIDQYSFNIMNKIESNEKIITLLNGILLSGFEKAIDVYVELLNGTCVKKYKVGNKIEITDTINLNSRASKEKLKELEDLNYQGDGIRSAVAILASLIVNEHSLYLIDEPETFLHPPQARLLGRNIVDLSNDKQCFISTHNIDLIRGILERNLSRVKIIKIDRVGNTNEFHVLDNQSITDIAGDKNLKYSNILNGLFYNKVVLCENESDCKFYSAILESLDSNTYQNTLFCAVGGKDQFKLIIPLLKKLGICYSIIADIDLINDKDKLRQLLNAAKPNIYNEISTSHNNFLVEFEEKTESLVKKQAIIKQEIEKIFTVDEYMSQASADKIKEIIKNINSLKLLKNGGKAIIPSGKCTVEFNIIEKFLNENNIFILDCGEIERFVPEIDMHGSAWVEEVFKRYKDINDSIYDKAKEFIKKVFE